MYTHIHIYTYTHIHIYTRCMNDCFLFVTHTHTHTHAYMHTCIHTHMHTCIHAYMHTYVYSACLYTFLSLSPPHTPTHIPLVFPLTPLGFPSRPRSPPPLRARSTFSAPLSLALTRMSTQNRRSTRHCSANRHLRTNTRRSCKSSFKSRAASLKKLLPRPRTRKLCVLSIRRHRCVCLSI